MKPRELTVQDVALFSRLIVEKADYEGLSEEEKQNCTLALTAAKAFAAGYAGLDMDTVDLDDVAYAVLVIAAEMVDNHQMTNSKPARTLYFKGGGGGGGGPGRVLHFSGGPVFPYVFPLQVQNFLYESLHAGGAVLLHALCEVSISVKRESC